MRDHIDGVTVAGGARLRALLALVTVLALLLAACSGEGPADDDAADDGDGVEQSDDDTASEEGESDDDGAEEVASGGDLTVGVGAMPPTLDPFSATSPPRSFIVYSIYSTLTRIDPIGDDAEVIPNVADSWESIDETTWQFTLKDGLSFSNGEPLDAEAVVFAIDYVQDDANEAGIKGRIGPLRDAEAISDTVVQINLESPEVTLPRLMSALPIVPPQQFAEMGADAFFIDPIGTSFFQVDEFVPGESLSLSANPNSVLGAPRLDTLTFQVIPEDSARVAALAAGDVDVITKVPTDQAASVESSGDLVLTQVEPRTYNSDMFFTDGPLSDQRVRLALNLAVDSELLVETIMGGAGVPEQGQMVPPGVEGYCERIEPFGYDLDEANRLMSEAGVSGLDLTLASSQGFLTNDVLLNQAIAEQIEQLDAVDSVEIEVMEFSFFLEHFYLDQPRKDLFFGGMSSAPFVSATAPLERYTTGYPQRDLGYSSAEYDETFLELQATPEGTAERQELFCQLSEILREDVPSLPVMYMPDLWGYDPSVADFQVDIAGNPPFELIGRAG